MNDYRVTKLVNNYLYLIIDIWHSKYGLVSGFIRTSGCVQGNMKYKIKDSAIVVSVVCHIVVRVYQ